MRLSRLLDILQEIHQLSKGDPELRITMLLPDSVYNVELTMVADCTCGKIHLVHVGTGETPVFDYIRKEEEKRRRRIWTSA